MVLKKLKQSSGKFCDGHLIRHVCVRKQLYTCGSQTAPPKFVRIHFYLDIKILNTARTKELHCQTGPVAQEKN